MQPENLENFLLNDNQTNINKASLQKHYILNLDCQPIIPHTLVKFGLFETEAVIRRGGKLIIFNLVEFYVKYSK